MKLIVGRRTFYLDRYGAHIPPETWEPLRQEFGDLHPGPKEPPWSYCLSFWADGLDAETGEHSTLTYHHFAHPCHPTTRATNGSLGASIHRTYGPDGVAVDFDTLIPIVQPVGEVF